MMFVEGGVEYAKAYLDGEFTDKLDFDKVSEILSSVGGTVTITPYTNEATGTTFENYLMVLSEYVVF